MPASRQLPVAGIKKFYFPSLEISTVMEGLDSKVRSNLRYMLVVEV